MLRLLDNKECAILGLNNFGGLVILLDESDDTLQVQFDFGADNLSEIEEVEIEYIENEEGDFELGFTLEGEKYLLNEFMRVNL